MIGEIIKMKDKAKKYCDMNNAEIREISFDKCPCKCTVSSGACELTPVGFCRAHLSKNLDNN
jgi:hypothetical protein